MTDYDLKSSGLHSHVVDALTEAGFETFADIDAASDDDLLAVNGIGPAYLSSIREEAKSRATPVRGYADGPAPR